MKIAIIGYSGSGKSTLAKKLSQKHGVPVLYLDTVHWLPGWEEAAREQELARVQEFLAENGGWVIDGNYGKLCFEQRMREADRIIFMRFNRFACLWRAIKRRRANRGKSRESMTEGCPEKIDAAFAWWILFKGRSAKLKKRYQSVLDTYGDKVTVIRCQRELNAFEREEL